MLDAAQNVYGGHSGSTNTAPHLIETTSAYVQPYIQLFNA